MWKLKMNMQIDYNNIHKYIYQVISLSKLAAPGLNVSNSFDCQK